jgi:hypothetical protein
MLETTVILRSLLLNAKTAKTKEEIEIAIENMCSKDDIAAVKESYEKLTKLKSGGDV